MDDVDDQIAVLLQVARELLGAADDGRALAEASRLVNQALALLVKCQVLAAQGDDGGALAAAEMAVRRAPRLAEAHYWRGALLGDLGHYRDGLRAIDRAFVHLAAGDEWLLEDLYYEKATMLEAIGERDAARATYEAGLERCPGSALLQTGIEPLAHARRPAPFKVLRGGLS
jgi:tetratricopeptide (TPR) repeat protein